jgi:hypothetical protein
LQIFDRPVAPRATRSTVIAASVPDDTSRTFSTDGTRAHDRLGELDFSARWLRRTRCPSARGALHRLDDLRVRVPEDRRAPRLHVVDVPFDHRCRRGTRPRALATKKGSPPTDANDRTGESTPPGITASARSYSELTTGVRRLRARGT